MTPNTPPAGSVDQVTAAFIRDLLRRAAADALRPAPAPAPRG